MDINENARAVLKLVMPTIRRQLAAGRRPVVLGLTGLQGAGKSTWASAIVADLESQHHLRAIQVSLDDFYYPHDTLKEIRMTNADNALLRTRGEPGTHDEELAASFFDDLRSNRKVIRIPCFDKGACGGQGDRLPGCRWPSYHGPVDVVVFEGWCVGFSPISSADIKERRDRASKASISGTAKDETTTLQNHTQLHLEQMNEALARYCKAFMGPQHLDILVQLDTDSLANVYRWRLEQEHAMLQRDGCGMTDSEVVQFIQGYMPAYELYLEGLRDGFFRQKNFRRGLNSPQLQVLLGPKREVIDMTLLS